MKRDNGLTEPHRYEFHDILYRDRSYKRVRAGPWLAEHLPRGATRLTPDEFSFGLDLCFRHWREMARTDAPSASASYLTDEVRNGGSDREGQGKVTDFVRAGLRFASASARGVNGDAFYASSATSRCQCCSVARSAR